MIDHKVFLGFSLEEQKVALEKEYLSFSEKTKLQILQLEKMPKDSLFHEYCFSKYKSFVRDLAFLFHLGGSGWEDYCPAVARMALEKGAKLICIVVTDHTRREQIAIRDHMELVRQIYGSTTDEALRKKFEQEFQQLNSGYDLKEKITSQFLIKDFTGKTKDIIDSAFGTGNYYAFETLCLKTHSNAAYERFTETYKPAGYTRSMFFILQRAGVIIDAVDKIIQEEQLKKAD